MLGEAAEASCHQPGGEGLSTLGVREARKGRVLRTRLQQAHAR